MTKLTLNIVKLYHLIQESEKEYVRVEAKMHGKHLFVAYHEDMLESLEVLIRRNEYQPELLNLAEILEQFIKRCLIKYEGAIYVGMQEGQVVVINTSVNTVLHSLTINELVASTDFTSKAAANITKAINNIQEALKDSPVEPLPITTKRRDLLASALDAVICEGKPVLVFNTEEDGINTTNRITAKQLVAPQVVDNVEYLIKAKGYDNLKISLLRLDDSTAEILITEQLTEQRVAIIFYNTGTGKTSYKHIWYNLMLIPLTFFNFPNQEVNSDYLESTYAFSNIPRAEQVPQKQ